MMYVAIALLVLFLIGLVVAIAAPPDQLVRRLMGGSRDDSKKVKKD
jgi:hypothetical protein